MSYGITNAISDSITPQIIPNIYADERENQKVIVCEIYRGSSTLYYIKSLGKKDGTYIRTAGTTRLADEGMLKELKLTWVNRSYDELPYESKKPLTNEEIDALSNISAMYDEGLILTNFYYKGTGALATKYLDKYFKNTTTDAAYGFMMYDYSAANCAANDIVDGVGTDPTKRKNGFENFSQTGIMPVLPPLTYWQTGGTDGKYTKSLIRYAESSRSLKSYSWCIPSTSDNIEDACRLMDYMYSEEGSLIQDFGPSQYLVTSDKTKWNTIAYNKSPELNKTFKQMMSDSGKDFRSFMLENIGSTQGIGCVRSAALDVASTNYYGQAGLINVKRAINNGVLCLANVDKYETNKFDTTVPTAGYGSVSIDNAKKYGGITAFWASDKFNSDAIGWTAVVTAKYSDFFDVNGNFNFASTTILVKDNDSNNYTPATIKEQLVSRRTVYLYTLANGLGKEYVPSCAIGF